MADVQVVSHESSYTGWIILGIVLIVIVVLVLFAILVRSLFAQTNPNGGNTCFGGFGLQTGADGTALNQCGDNRTSACVFPMTNLDAAVTQCNVLSDICQAFSFNSTTLTMKIVPPSAIFSSPGVDLYVRQNGQSFSV